MAGLLISVRSAEEAAAALAGGADLIDVKEPALGSLGRAADAVIAAVIAVVAGRRPVSAACGELLEDLPAPAAPQLAFVKWGLAGCGKRPDWAEIWRRRQLVGPCAKVLVAYADWQCAQAPPVQEIVTLAEKMPGSVLLIDTCCKEPNTLTRGRRPTLLDWLPAPEVSDLCGRCRAAKVRVALAGSLGMAEIHELLPARPDWFAVRGAACSAGHRQGQVQERLVRQLRELLGGTPFSN